MLSLATEEQLQQKSKLRQLIKYYKRTKNEERVEDTQRELQVLCSECVFISPLDEPSQPEGQWANEDTKAIRRAVKMRVSRINSKAEKEVVNWKKTEDYNRLIYLEDFLRRLDQKYRWQAGVKKVGEADKVFVNKGRMEYTYEDARGRLVGLMKKASKVTSDKYPQVEYDDLFQEVELKLFEVYRSKYGTLGIDSFCVYFKCVMWRHLSKFRNTREFFMEGRSLDELVEKDKRLERAR